NFNGNRGGGTWPGVVDVVEGTHCGPSAICRHFIDRLDHDFRYARRSHNGVRIDRAYLPKSGYELLNCDLLPRVSALADLSPQLANYRDSRSAIPRTRGTYLPHRASWALLNRPCAYMDELSCGSGMRALP